ncbi:MAG: nuclear transport factor 2 family protein [Erythrobacter sp.]|nr:nuclear transport factor 2 family protein [Erythrobacter sp.]
MSSLQELIDERAIRDGLARFARVIDGKAWNQLDTVFAPDVTFDYGDGTERQGLPALEANMRRYLDACGPTQHLIGSVAVDFSGARAVSRAYVQARHQRADDPLGPVFDTCGEYIDQWERREGGWRIVRRLAIWAMHSGDPAIIHGGG